MSARPRFATRAARTAAAPPSRSRPLVPPVHLANVYVFEDLEQVDAVWEGREPGYVYGRFGTPSHAALEETLAALEGGESGLATSSGMGALSAFLLGGLRPGDHVVAGQDLYGATTALLREQAGRWGIRVTFTDATEAALVEAAITDATRAIFVEALSNPLVRVADLPGLGALARRRGLILLVDSTLASPALLRPLEHGATAVHHSATKYLSGHGDVTAGVLVGPRPLVDAARAEAVRVGLNLAPFDAWLTQRGVRTLALRMERHSANALELAEFLAGRAEIARVHYPGLPDHPQHRLARTLFPSGYGGMLSFELRRRRAGDRAALRGPGRRGRGRRGADPLRPELRGRDDDVELPGAHVPSAALGPGSREARDRSGACAAVRRDRRCGGPQGIARPRPAGGRGLSANDIACGEGKP